MGGKEQLDPFFRLFVIPAMFHCRGGDGPDAVDFLSAMETWVEKKSAPEKLIALKANQSPPTNTEYLFPLQANEVLFSRPIYTYPWAARYSGQGDAKDASTWIKN